MTHKLAAQVSTWQAKATEAASPEDGSVSFEQALISGGLCVLALGFVAFLSGKLDGFTANIHP